MERLELLIGDKNIEKIKATSVLIIGLGGVGGYALESLIRSGIENVIIVDNDVIDETNINRQIIALRSNIGNKKTLEFQKRIKNINNNCKIKIYDEFITKDNIDMLLENKIDYLIDACDTITTKIELIKKCLNKNIKFISVMGTGNKLDPSQLEITDIRKTSYDPIAKIIRKKIKEDKINGKIPVIFSKEKPIKSKKVSSNAFVPATAGLLCTSYVINDIVKSDLNE